MSNTTGSSSSISKTNEVLNLAYGTASDNEGMDDAIIGIKVTCKYSSYVKYGPSSTDIYIYSGKMNQNP